MLLSCFKKTLCLFLPDYWVAGLRAYKHWFFGDPELRILRYLNDPEKCSVDVGANTGVYTFFLRKYSSICHAIEPNPHLAELLMRSFSSDVHVFEGALSDQNGETTLSIPIIGEKESPGLASVEHSNQLAETFEVNTLKVPTMKLDDMDISTVGFIKIDVEGHELSVLKGGEQLLDRDGPNIIVEAEDRHKPDAVKSITGFLEARGYQGFLLINGIMHSIKEFDPRMHQNPKHITHEGKVLGKIYLNNFIFIRDEILVKRLMHLKF
jgi:FkbM family methyltransferase